MNPTRFGRYFFRSSVAAGLGVLLALSSLEAQRRAEPADTVVETTEVLAVEIPVQVLQDGQPVAGLTRDDFQLVDQRKKQDLLDFEVVDLRLDETNRFWNESDTKSIPLAARRHFLLLFDLSFSDPTAILRARDGAKKLILESLHPADMAGVVTFSESRGVNLVLNFTSDRRQMMKAIDELGLVDPLDQPNADPLKVGIGDIADRLENLADSQTTAGPGPGSELLTERLEAQLQNLQDASRMAAVSVREQKQSQIQTYMNAMSTIGQMLRQAKGNTQVVLLSEGFDSTVLMGNSVEDQARMQQIAEAAESGRYWEVDSNERFGSTAALFGLTQTIEEFRRSGAVIQAVDIGGLRATDLSGSAVRESGVKQDGLFVLANDTGGELFRNYNDFGTAMGEMLQRSSVTYLLTYQPKDLIADGGYRNIEIKLKGKRKGVRVVHRPGYYAPVPYTAADPTEKRMRTASMLFQTTSGGSFDLDALVVPTEQSDGRVLTAVVLDIEGAGLLAGTQGRMLPLEVYGYAFREDGTVADFFAQAMGLDLEEARLTLIDRGVRFWGDLALDPGRYRLRTLVRNSSTGRSSVQTLTVDVPDLLEGEPFLSEPLVREPEDLWLDARQQSRTARAHPFPYTSGPGVPATKPRLRSDREVEVVLKAVGVALEGLEVRAWASESDAAPTDLQGFRAGDVIEASLKQARGAAPGGTASLLVTIPPKTLESTDRRLVIAIEDRQGRVLHSSIEIDVEDIG